MMETRILVGIQFYVLREKLLIVLRLEFFEFLSCLILCCSYNSFSYFIIFVFVFYSLSVKICLSVSSIYIVWASFHFYWCKSFFFFFCIFIFFSVFYFFMSEFLYLYCPDSSPFLLVLQVFFLLLFYLSFIIYLSEYV